MKLIVANELETRTYQELSAIYANVSKFLIRSAPQPVAPRNTLLAYQSSLSLSASGTGGAKSVGQRAPLLPIRSRAAWTS